MEEGRPLSHETILLVDDDPAILQLFRDALEPAGYRTVGLEDGGSLQTTVDEVVPALIVLDIMMPGADGLTLCRQLRTGPRPYRGPIIICSAKHYQADKQVAGEVGANAYLEKPFAPGRLLSIVRDFLAREISVRWWGVRGSIPTASKETIRYGGNTPCVEVRISGVDDLFIWDGGTGLRELGRSLRGPGHRTRGFLCFSHFHWDHIQGLPFFEPAYVAGNTFSLIGPAQPTAGLLQILSGQMASVYFPVGLEQFGARLTFQEIGEGRFMFGGVEFDTLSSLHPGRALIYRLSHGGKRIVYATDNELPLGWKAAGGSTAFEIDRFVRFFDAAEVLIHDAQFTPEELGRRRGWGHSAWPDVIDLAMEAGVKHLVLFHHDPDHSDEALDEIQAAVRRKVTEAGSMLNCSLAREGDVVIV
jgi:phosphoribosyl 1,2-cyclic phosphodiesterase